MQISSKNCNFKFYCQVNELQGRGKTNNICPMRLIKHPHFYFLTALIPVFFFFFIQNKFSVNAPYSDDWNAINGLVIRYFSAGDSLFDKLSLIISQNNEHREGYLSMIAIIQFWIFGLINYRFFDLLGSISILGVLGIFYAYLIKFKKPRWIILPISFILFNFLFYQNNYWAICALQNNTILFFVLISFYFLMDMQTTYQYALAIFFAILATFTSGNGMLVFVAAWPLFKGSSLKQKAIWLTTFILVILPYYKGYVHPLHRGNIIDQIFLFEPILKTFFVYLGSSLSILNFRSINALILSSFFFGLFLTCVLLKFLKDHFKSMVYKRSINDFILSGLIFILSTMLVYSIGRANDPVALVFESRYAITMTVGLCLIALLFTDLLSNRLIFRYLFLAVSISFCVLTYTSKLVDSVNFNQVLSANFMKHHLQHREHFFYRSSEGNKVDLAQPLISDDYLLPKPMVSLSTKVTGSMTYLNEVIDISFSHHYVKLDPKLDEISRFMVSDFDTPLPKEKNHIAEFHLTFLNKVISYQNHTAKSLISSGSDGYYIVLSNKKNQFWVFNLFWENNDFKRQLCTYSGICVKNLSGNIPFKYLPDDTYTLRVINISGPIKEVIGELTQIKMIGI